MLRRCDGQDVNLIGEDGQSPCRCGLEFDDVDREVLWPHRRIPTQAERQAAIDALFAEHTDCGDDCQVGRIGRLTAAG